MRCGELTRTSGSLKSVLLDMRHWTGLALDDEGEDRVRNDGCRDAKVENTGAFDELVQEGECRQLVGDI